ncbi:hypothetical protein PanWU01x14_252860, partial [Parasponia andersonii]
KKAYAIAPIAASGSVIAAVIILVCLCVVRNKKKKQTSSPNPIRTKSLGATGTLFRAKGLSCHNSKSKNVTFNNFKYKLI